jgi:hypothetical protein
MSSCVIFSSITSTAPNDPVAGGCELGTGRCDPVYALLRRILLEFLHSLQSTAFACFIPSDCLSAMI